MPSVSVIVPIYNVAPYLAQCLESVVSQTLANIEIICVNDGSTDGSAEILAAYAEKDPRIRQINQANCGLSAARNVGSAIAKGQYIYFLDSDDYIASNAMEELYDFARKHDLDLLAFDGRSFFEDDDVRYAARHYENFYQRKNVYHGVSTGVTLFTAMSASNDYWTSVCLQFIKREFYRSAGLKFHEGILHEDHLFSLLCYLKALRAAHVSREYFFRRVRAGSIMTRPKVLEHVSGLLQCHLEILRHLFGKRYEESTSRELSRVLNNTYNEALSILMQLPKTQRETLRAPDHSVEGVYITSILTSQAGDRLKIKELTDRQRLSMEVVYSGLLRRLRGNKNA